MPETKSRADELPALLDLQAKEQSLTQIEREIKLREEAGQRKEEELRKKEPYHRGEFAIMTTLSEAERQARRIVNG